MSQAMAERTEIGELMKERNLSCRENDNLSLGWSWLGCSSCIVESSQAEQPYNYNHSDILTHKLIKCHFSGMFSQVLVYSNRICGRNVTISGLQWLNVCALSEYKVSHTSLVPICFVLFDNFIAIKSVSYSLVLLRFIHKGIAMKKRSSSVEKFKL